MRRLLLVLTVAAVTALALPAEAKPFTYQDPKDMPANGGLDIVSVSYYTGGVIRVTKSGRRTIRTYEPTKLYAVMTLAAAPVDQPGVKYSVMSQVEGCGEMAFTYSNGLASAALAVSQFRLGCGGPPGTTGGDTLFLDPQFAVKGTRLEWSVPLKSLPKDTRAGAILFGFRSSVDVAEPLVGLVGPEDFGDGVLDKAKNDGEWILS